MDEATAYRLYADATQALATHGITVGQGVNVYVGDTADGSGATVLLWLGHGHEGRASDVLAALEDSGLTAQPHTKDPAALGVVDWLQSGGHAEVCRKSAA